MCVQVWCICVQVCLLVVKRTIISAQVKVRSIPKYLADKRQDGYTIAGLEQTAESCPITEYQFEHKTVLVLGYVWRDEGAGLEVMGCGGSAGGDGMKGQGWR